MINKELLAFLAAGSLALIGCGGVVDGAASAGGSNGGTTGAGSGGGSSGSGSGVCAPGDHFSTFGASGDDGATIGIAADASGVYWTNDDGSLWKAKASGAAPALIAKGFMEPWTVALDEGFVYVADYTHALYAVDKAGGAPKLLASASVTTVATGPGGVYFATNDGVFQAKSDGSAPTLLDPIDKVWAMAADAEYIYAKTTGDAADPTTRILRVPIKGGINEDIAPAEKGLYTYSGQELAIDASFVYWINSSEGTLMKVAKTGGQPVALAEGLADPVSVTVDKGEVFFTVRGKDGGSTADRAVAKVSSAGGAITYLAHGPSTSAFGVAVDATNAYWTAKVTGSPVSTACR